MCADKAKEKANNPSVNGEPEQETGNEFYVGGPKSDTDAAGKLRKLFSTRGAAAVPRVLEPSAKATAAEKQEAPAKTAAPEAKQEAPPKGRDGSKSSSKKDDPIDTAQQLPAIATPPEPVQKSTSGPATSKRGAKAPKVNRTPAMSRTFSGGSKKFQLKLASPPEIISSFRSRSGLRASAVSGATDNLFELDIKNFKGHLFLRKDSMQEFAYRIKEVTKDWDDFRFVEPADDVEWHRSSLNQALNDFAAGLALPLVRMEVDEKISTSVEPQYAMGTGVIIVRGDDIKNANSVDIGALYHELLHSEQDAAIIRSIALASTVNKPLALNSAEIMNEYCHQTGIDAVHVSRDWIHLVLQASTDWLKRKSDDIKKYMKKNPSTTLPETFERDRELVRARELTEAVSERMRMHRHLMRKHQLLVYAHREFARNLPAHIYVERFEQSISFQRTILGYDWQADVDDASDHEFVALIKGKADFIRSVLFGKTDDWLGHLPHYYRSMAVGTVTKMKMKALARAFEAEVKDRGDTAQLRAFDDKYSESMRKMLTEIEDSLAEQIRLKRIRHYLGVELELEANHVAHTMNKLYGQYAATMFDRLDEQADDFLTQISELNEKLPPLKPDVLPVLPENEDQAAVIVRGSFERQPPDILIAKNRRVTYGGREWQVADFNHDTGDVILHRAEERTVDPSQVSLADKQPSLNEMYRIRTETGQIDDGWIYRGKDESGQLRMFKPNAERIEVPKLALISVNQLLANARAVATDSAAQMPLIQPLPPQAPGVMDHALGIQQMSWAGSQLGSYLIEELLSDRKFYWIYSGNDQSSFEKKVFKVAKPLEYLHDMDVIDPLKSSVLKLSSVGFSPVVPSVSGLLKLQCERMSHDTAHIMARIEEVCCTEALCYARMEFIEGVTLRQLRKHGPLSLDVALDIVNALDTIQKNQDLHYHGDLTPDNIMISYSTVKLLDAGYFGALDCIDGMVEDAAITTPAYYPFLTPNDMLALGIIFWELHFGRNPFASFDEMPATATGVSQTLVRVLKGYSSIGRPFVNSMARLPFPHSIEPSINPELAKFLLASLGLRINEQNELDAAPRFESFAQIADALNHLAEQGITEL